MALANYGDLKTAVATYLNRSDLTSYIPDFVRLCERRIAYGSSDPYPSQPVRVPAMQSQATGTLSSSGISFPSDFVEIIRLAASDGSASWQLEHFDLSTFTNYFNQQTQPVGYTFLNNKIYTAPTYAATYTLDYYAKFTALSNDADYNWLLTNAPDVYLFGSLIESAPFLGDSNMAQAWFGMYRSAVNSLNVTTKRTGPLRVRAV